MQNRKRHGTGLWCGFDRPASAATAPAFNLTRYRPSLLYPPLEGEGRLALSAAICETGWGGGLTTRAVFKGRDCHPTPPLISFASTLPLQGRVKSESLRSAHPPHHGPPRQRKTHQHEGRGDLGTADQDARRGLHLVPFISLERTIPAAFAKMPDDAMQGGGEGRNLSAEMTERDQ